MFRRRLVKTLFIAALLTGVGWWQRQPVLAWWHVRQLVQADAASREACVDRVLALDEAALPRLLAALESPDEIACGNVEAALFGLACRWKTLDPRAARLLDQLRDRFAGFSAAGQISAVQAAAGLLHQGDESELLPAPLTEAAGSLLKAGGSQAALRPAVLRLAGALVARTAPGPWQSACRALAQSGLSDPQPATRVAALHLSMREAMRAEPDLLRLALPLLRDPEAEVRRAALLALGPVEELVSEDELLPLLHDADAEVQQMCELALRGRGLQDRHLELARLISDDRPTARLQVLQYLRGSDVEPGVWLRRLSHDVSPAVRAAAVRAAAGQPEVDLHERLNEMRQRDASPTVRELAAHYLAPRSAPSQQSSRTINDER